MPVHKLVSQTLSNSTLPYVIHVNGLDIPYQAELWIGGNPTHRSGVASLHLSEQGYLTVEYVAYDVGDMSDRLGLAIFGESSCKVVILDTNVEIPVYGISISRTKARTLYSKTAVPNVVVYEGRVTGWLGKPGSEVESATMFMTDFPDVVMPSHVSNVPDRPINKILTLRGNQTANAVLTLDAGEWTIEFYQPDRDDDDTSAILSVANVSKRDGTPFVIDDAENNILSALQIFLSFQCESWVNTALIVCHHKDSPSRIGELAHLGRLSTTGYAGRSSWTASDYNTWPRMFARFWTLLNRPQSVGRLLNAMTHYVSSSAVIQNPQSLTYGIVPARSTLEALVKWWNDLPHEFEFRGEGEKSFIGLLLKAIQRAELGRDVGAVIDIEEVEAVIKRGTHFRHTIDHGSAGNIVDDDLESVIALQLYFHNLARLLISAKLELRDRHARGNFYSPKFVEI